MSGTRELKAALDATVNQAIDEAHRCRAEPPCRFCKTNADKIVNAAVTYAISLTEEALKPIPGDEP